MEKLQYKVVDYPPEGIYEKAKELWGVDFDKGTVFTYGDTIHAKSKMSEDLLRHELTHVKQQTEMGKEIWWDRYFTDKEFRTAQELEAYRAQYKWVLDNVKDRNTQAGYLYFFTRCLSGDMYGNVLKWNEASALIKSND